MEEYPEYIQVGDEEFELGKPDFAGACFGFNVTPRKNMSPLLTMFVEDDGCWHKKTSFDASWADDIIEQLQAVKKEHKV